MEGEPRLVFQGASGLRVYEYRGYQVFAPVAPGHREDLPGYYPIVSFLREGEQRAEFLTPTLTYTAQRRRDSIEEGCRPRTETGDRSD